MPHVGSSPADALEAALREDGATPPVRRALGRLARRGADAWPDLSPPTERVAAVAAQLVAEADDPVAALDDCDAGEVWLAAACEAGIDAAMRALDRRYIAPLDHALAPTGLDAGAMAEVKQRVRDKLLGTDGDGMMRLSKYCGRGRLAAMAKVIAIRSAVDHKRVQARHPERAVGGDALAVQRLVDGDLGPELAAITKRQHEVLKHAFERAVEQLEPIDRGVLRMHLVERLSIDEIASLHNVHRATAARRLIKIRERLSDWTRRALGERLEIEGDTELDSWMKMVTARVDLSISRLLATSDGG